MRINNNDIAGVTKYIENIWKEFSPENPFEYHFLDETLERQYAAEQRMSKIFTYFSFLGILISCLGLFGLASFMAERRTKEIGIRKVLGASITNIVLIFSKEFAKWVLVANLIAWPIAWYAMSSWLQNFASRTSIGIWIFIVSAVLALAVALLTVSFQAFKAAVANPVDALKYE